MKYKVGDMVRVRSDLKIADSCAEYGIEVNHKMVDMAGKIVTIKDVGCEYYKINECSHLWTDKMFEGCVKKPSREDLLKMPVGTKIITDKGNEYVYDGEDFTDKNDALMFYIIDDNLKLIDDDKYYGNKIIEVQIPEYKTIWKESPKKMTLKEIEKELGYSVEIVEEEN